jgi:phosphonate transport system substrate-binding protein
MADLGSAERPVRVFFVPSVDVQAIVSGGDIMAAALNEATGMTFEVVVPTSYAATIEEMCASPDDSMGFIPGLGYVLANELCGVDVAFKAVRFGWDIYWTQFLVPADSDATTLEDLDGLKWVYPDTGSTSGYLVPNVMFNEAGITPGERLEAGGSHTSTVRALYNGEADFATTFYSPWLTPEGVDAWKEGDNPEVPADLIESCAPNEDGTRLFCSGYRILDARAGIREEAPDVIQKLRIIFISPAIPNDTLSFGPDFPADVRDEIIAALIAFAETDAWDESIGNQDFYGWTGINPATDAEYDLIRSMVALAGIDLENIGD